MTDKEKALKLKTIDLSICIKSGIDMEFSNSGHQWTIGKLTAADEDGYCDGYDDYEQCRVRENRWMYWEGSSNNPLPEGLQIEYQINELQRRIYTCNFEYRVDEFQRRVYMCNSDEPDWARIVAFKVLGLADGCIYELDEDK